MLAKSPSKPESKAGMWFTRAGAKPKPPKPPLRRDETPGGIIVLVEAKEFTD